MQPMRWPTATRLRRTSGRPGIEGIWGLSPTPGRSKLKPLRDSPPIERGKGEPMAEFFPGVPKIQYGGPKSRNPLEFKHYNPDEEVGGKPMKDHLRFSVVYWHTFVNPLSDPFGVGTAVRPWDDGTNSVANA